MYCMPQDGVLLVKYFAARVVAELRDLECIDHFEHRAIIPGDPFNRLNYLIKCLFAYDVTLHCIQSEHFQYRVVATSKRSSC